jgi:hypothetical protein
MCSLLYLGSRLTGAKYFCPDVSQLIGILNIFITNTIFISIQWDKEVMLEN